MNQYIIKGGAPLAGEVVISGAKKIITGFLVIIFFCGIYYPKRKKYCLSTKRKDSELFRIMYFPNGNVFPMQ